VSLADTLDVRLVTSDRAVLTAFPRLTIDLRDFAAGR
jgi:hypothetical protein